MSASTSLDSRLSSSLVPPVLLVVSDLQLIDDGVSVVSTCLLHRLFEYSGVSRVRFTAAQQFPVGVLLLVSAPTVHHVIDHFPRLTHDNFIEMCRFHSIWVATLDSRGYIRDCLRVHFCSQQCGDQFSSWAIVTEDVRTRTRDEDASQHRRSYNFKIGVVEDIDPAFPSVRTEQEKCAIILDWQSTMSAKAQKRGACAICGYNVLASELSLVEPAKINFSLLQNECLPEHTLPQSYDFELYG
ncbi:uncharacterized protein EDB91DRAFT_1264097 [Suillus paluster]|uniref:uncharacterized protein n=1 Tax=Suillus paluster TaxID=48578 RepID=UPI001B883CD9|nr:uncharacterized protein EDB91DRAFT_1264097 [Suillus paluster]KAG1726071.1 hypothetical protein EDB91DRAFT_1264097 [Suillus paluster]